METESGAVIVGCNVENASYSATICAERVAITRAVAEGHRRFRAIAVAGPAGATTSPCGACRQFIAEFDPALPVLYSSPDGPVKTTLAQLLPAPFSSGART